MDDFMQWAMNSLDQQQQQHHHHHHAVAPPAYGGTDGSGAGVGSSAVAGPAAFPSLQALRRQSTAAGGGLRDLTVQVDQQRGSNSWTASSCDSPSAAAMDHDATLPAGAGWSPHTARARTSRPMSWNFSAASAQTTDASLASPAAVRGGPSTPAAGRRAGGILVATTASHGTGGGGGTAASSSASASAGGPVQDHIIAERRRREKINQRFIELSTVIPGLKKMDKATILSDATRHVKQLQEKVKALEAAGGGSNGRSVVGTVVLVKKPCYAAKGDENGSPSSASSGSPAARNPLPEIEVRFSEDGVMVRVVCDDAKGVVVRVLSEVEEGLHLSITHANVMAFTACTVIITITAKVEGGFTVTAEDIVGRLNSVLQQNCNYTSTEETEN